VNRLFPFATAMPEGIFLSASLVFLFLGVVSTVNLSLRNQGRYAVPATVHVAAGILAVLARDLMTLLVAWEVLTFSAFVLIRGRGHTRGRLISLRYLTMQLTAAIFFFFAALVHYRETGSLALEVLVSSAQPFMVVAILIKTATVPVHFWLIEAYPSVDPAITPLLSVFTTKVGVITAAQTVMISPAGYPLLAWIGAGTAVVAVLFALAQHNARRLLSYHIVSQVGYMIAGIGLAALATAPPAATVPGGLSPAITAGVFHLVTHTLYKALLLLVAAQAIYAWGHEDLTRMGGLGLKRPILLVCGLIGAMAISGVPFTSGYASKYLLKEAAGAQPAIALLLNIASVGTGLSFIKFIYLVFFNRPSGGTGEPERYTSMVPLVLAAGVTVVIGAFPHVVPGVPRRDFFAPSSVGSALLPLIASVLLWTALRKRLTRPGPEKVHRGTSDKEELPELPVTRWILRTTANLRLPARLLHEQGPQIQVLLILVVLVAVAWLLQAI
jgi:formate hydrogenlyase subunit 3/multisubunit Na+/H+ antiporter MnhD subunit